MIKGKNSLGRLLAFGTVLASGLLLAACATEPPAEGESEDKSTKEAAPAKGEAAAEEASEEMAATQLPNPAAVFCIDQGGQHEIRTGEDGAQTSYCILPDGTEVDAWDYFRENAG